MMVTHVVRRARSGVAAFLVALSVSCAFEAEDGGRNHDALAAAPAEPQAHRSAALPPIGIAVSDTAGAWCAMFRSEVAQLVHSGDAVAIAFGDSAGVLHAAVRQRRATECETAFPQPRWHDYIGFNLDMQQDAAAGDIVGLAVVGSHEWLRDAHGNWRADLDGDGTPEEVRRCAADEGEHFTVWSRNGAGRVRRWHEYFDWGALVDVTCGAAESDDE